MNAQLVLDNVTVRLPHRTLFERVNWSLYEGMRVALAGRNGSGKSTLMRIIAGRAEPTEGKCTTVGGKRLRIGFLDQSLLDSAALEHQQNPASPIAFITSQISSDSLSPDSSDRSWQIRKVLSGLGFSDASMNRPMNQLSGGWLLRVFIAEALVHDPDVLLLDEPTNHLDISSIQWLEEFLTKEYRGTLILITHDISLQKKATNSIAVIQAGAFFFRKNQNDYLTFYNSLGEEKRLLGKNIESLDKKIEENMNFVLKFRAKASTAARAQSKLKLAEQLKQERDECSKRLSQLEGAGYNLHFRFRHATSGSKFPLSVRHVSFQYADPEPWILKDVSFDITHGQRIAIIGDNGTGKTTLLNVLARRLKPQTGEIVQGSNAVLGYFGQHQLDELSLDNTVFENLSTKTEGIGLETLRGWLGAFGFSGNAEIEKKAKLLSGGERARLALLRTLVTQINVCLLDEPTNHLDIETKQLLKQAMLSFEGSIIFVSHDREFIQAIADRILYLSHDHRLIDHLGDLDSFFAKYPECVAHNQVRPKPSTAPKHDTTRSRDPGLSFEHRKKLKNRTKTLEKRITALEAEIETLGISKQSAIDASDFEKLQAVEALLHEKMLEWEKLSTELEQLRTTIQSFV